MADFKCANPEYALDVDSMTLDYVLYKAIEAHLRGITVFTVPATSNNVSGSTFTADQKEATRLLEVFDSLIRIFRLNHPSVELKERVQFNMKILQFLCLLHLGCRDGRSQSREDVELPEQMREHLQTERIVNRGYRQHWMKLRRQQNPDYSSDSRPKRPEINDESVISFESDLLVRFLEISEELAYGVALAEISDKWATLAAEFMLQSVIQILSSHISTPNYLSSEDDWFSLKDALEECFAWGFVERRLYEDDVSPVVETLKESEVSVDEALRASLEERADLEDRVLSTLFNKAPSDDADGDSAMNHQAGEPANWTAARRESLHEIYLTLSSMRQADASRRRVPIDILRENHPREDFLKKLLDFFKQQWSLLNKSDWHGKPILLQIEEGKIDGMSDEDFKAFKLRVGI